MKSENLTIGSIAYKYENNAAIAIKVVSFRVVPHCRTMNHSLDVFMTYLSAKDGEEHEIKLYFATEIYANLRGDGTLEDKYEISGTQIVGCLNKNISLTAQNKVGVICYERPMSYDKVYLYRYKWIDNSAKKIEVRGELVGSIEITKQSAEIIAPDRCYAKESMQMLRTTYVTKEECERENKAKVFLFD